MTKTEDSATAFLVLRAWRHPDGPLCARIAAALDPAADPISWQVCTGIDPVLDVVRTWLQRISLESPIAAPDR